MTKKDEIQQIREPKNSLINIIIPLRLCRIQSNFVEKLNFNRKVIKK